MIPAPDGGEPPLRAERGAALARGHARAVVGEVVVERMALVVTCFCPFERVAHPRSDA